MNSKAESGFIGNSESAHAMSSGQRAQALRPGMWHAYASDREMARGTWLLVTGGHQPVRITAGDRLTIEMPGGQRYSGLVVAREGDSITLTGQDGVTMSLRAAPEGPDRFAGFQLSEGFTRETWSID